MIPLALALVAAGAITVGCGASKESTPVDRVVPVTGVSLKAATSLVVGGAEQLTAVVTPDNVTNRRVTWRSSNPGIATVNGTGMVTAVAAGTAIITVTTVEGGMTASCVVTVVAPVVAVTGVSLDRATLSLTAGSPGTSATLTATVLPSNATNQTVTWSTDNTSVATVSAVTGGTVTVVGHAAGMASITVTTADGAKVAVCAVTVDPVKVTGVTVKSATSLVVGGAEQLAAAVAPANATDPGVTWKSSNPTVATVSAAGLVTALNAGTATVTVTTVDGGKTASCTVTVSTANVAVAGVSLSATTLALSAGSPGTSATLTATVAPATATNQNVSWSTSNASVATVSATAGGTVTVVAHAAGTASVTVTTADGAKTAVCAVTVAPVAVTGVTVKSATSLLVGGSEQLTATVSPSNATNPGVTWKSSDPTVATVSATGLVTAVKAGTATVTVTTADGGKTASCAVTVTTPVVAVTGVSLAPTTLPLFAGNPGTSAVLSATVAPSTATNQNVTWSSDNTSVATVSATAGSAVTVVAHAPGKANITVTTVDGKKTAVCAVTVAPVKVAGVALDRTAVSLNPGGTATLTATVAPANATDPSVTWTSSNTAVATVDGAGLVTAVGLGNATVTATTTDGAKTASCAVTVTAVTVPVTGVTLDPTLSLTAGSPGTSATLTATVVPAAATNQNVTWATSDATVATVGPTGGSMALVVAHTPGTATITVTTADGAKTALCTVTVAPVPVTGVAVDQASLPLVEGGTATLAAIVSPIDATDTAVTWTSSDSLVASLSSSTGSSVTVTANAVGNATITVTTRDGGKTAVATVTVGARVYPVTGVTLDQTALTLTEGDTRTLTATVSPSNATDQAVTWASDNDTVASPSLTAGSSVSVIAKKAGVANITVTTHDGARTAVATVTVNGIPVNSISLDATTPLLLGKVGSATTGTLTATVGPTNASNKNVLWSTSNPAIATVSAPGGVATVTAVGAGIATITATTEDGGLTASRDVNVALFHQAITPATATQLHAGKTGGYDTLYPDPQAIETLTGGLALFAQGDGFKSDGGHFMFNNFGAGGGAAVPGNVNLKLRSYVGLPLASIQTSSPSVKVLLTATPYPGTQSMIGIGRHRNVVASWGYVGVVATKDTSTPSPIEFDGMPPNVQLDVFNAGKDGTYTYLDLIRVEPSSTAAIDNLAPDEVTGVTRITDSANAVTLGWKAPADADFDHVECGEGSTVVTAPAKPSTPGTCVFSSLAVGAHTFTVKTVDTHGNVSAGVTTTVTLTATPPLLEVLIPADMASAYLNDDGSNTYSTSGAEMPVHGLVFYAQKNRFKNGDKDGGIMTNFVGANATKGSTAALPMYVGIPIAAMSAKATVTVTVYAKVYPGKLASLGLAQQTSVANGTVVEVLPLTASATPSAYVFPNVPADRPLDLFNAAATGSGSYMYIESIRVE
jgi:uncharacterized protein YjdB